jgi:hypothetical protein
MKTGIVEECEKDSGWRENAVLQQRQKNQILF